jgi:carboxymethylenebutenolidase
MLERRTVVKGLGTLPLAAVLADAGQSRAAAATLEPVTLKTPGGRTVAGALARPAAERAPGVVLIHEWWGLNDQIKAVAADLAATGYVALAIDLLDGQVATTPDAAQALVGRVDEDTALDTLVGWIDWLRHQDFCTGRVATLGWCFGGGWSLQASLATPVDATVIYYGRVVVPAEKLAALKGPVLGQFATRDQYITPAMVDGFQAEMARAGKSLELYRYDADHAFANPTGHNYHRDDAQLAWQRTLAFLATNLK